MPLCWDDLLIHRAELRQWLSSARPGGETAANWWLGVALIATEAVQSAVTQGDLAAETTLGVAVEAINIATEEGTVGPADRAVRLANLAGLVADAGQTLETPPELRPEVAARGCLDALARYELPEGLEAGDWRSLAVEEMRELRRVKNLVTPLGRLLPHLEDDRLVEEVAKWIAVYPRLP